MQATWSTRLGVQTPVSDDLEIIHRVLQGEIDCFAELIARYRQHVARIVTRHVPGDRVAEVAHDVFVRAYGGLAGFASQAPFEHWLSSIAVRTCYHFWRAMRRQELPVSALTEEHHQWMEQVLAAESDDRFREQVKRREAAELSQWALSHLSAENRLVLTLLYLDGHSAREAAGLLGWSVAKVKVRAHRARQTLRKLLRDEWERKDDDTTQ
ncbi:MAG: sigma-70 family RNA polymerase sigma factor [Nitrospirae bacterium]|nr:MAG: sigma-70 family RNA polymerase sigma factor [Nitrospirota bacterium]